MPLLTISLIGIFDRGWKLEAEVEEVRHMLLDPVSG
jgi:hypothetical protein